MRNQRMSLALLFLIGFTGVAQAYGKKPVLYLEEITYWSKEELELEVAKKCKPHYEISGVLGFKKRKFRKSYSDLVQKMPEDSTDYHTLTIEIIDTGYKIIRHKSSANVHSGLSSTFDGYLCVRGTLRDKEGNLVGSFYAYDEPSSMRPDTTSSDWGICGDYSSLSRGITNLVIKWLKAPTKDALLGKLKKAQKVKDRIEGTDEE